MPELHTVAEDVPQEEGEGVVEAVGEREPERDTEVHAVEDPLRLAMVCVAGAVRVDSPRTEGDGENVEDMEKDRETVDVEERVADRDGEEDDVVDWQALTVKLLLDVAD